MSVITYTYVYSLVDTFYCRNVRAVMLTQPGTEAELLSQEDATLTPGHFVERA